MKFSLDKIINGLRTKAVLNDTCSILIRFYQIGGV